MKLIAPVRVIAVLKMEPLSQGRCQGYLAAVLAHGARKADWIVTHAVRGVVPACDGHSGEAGFSPGYGVRPGLVCQGADR